MIYWNITNWVLDSTIFADSRREIVKTTLTDKGRS